MDTAIQRKISGGAIALAVIGFVISVIGGLVFSICLFTPEPRPVTLPVWIADGADVVPRTKQFVATVDPRYIGVAPLSVGMEQFKRQAAGQKYIASFRQTWLTGTPALNDEDAWTVNYVVRNPNTGLLITASENIPWSNRPGWFTNTVFDEKSRVFTDVSTGRSFILLGVMAAVIAIGLGMMGLAYAIRYE